MAFSIHDDPSALARDVEAELHATAPRNTIRNLAIMLGSLLLFILFLSLSSGPMGIAVLVGVLLIHETGHLIAMRLFGYRDVQMFFIPFFGAARAHFCSTRQDSSCSRSRLEPFSS